MGWMVLPARGRGLLAPVYIDNLVDGLVLAAGKAVTEPLWRMPLWDPYDDMLKSDVADLRRYVEALFAVLEPA